MSKQRMLDCKSNFNIKYEKALKTNPSVWKITGRGFLSSLKNSNRIKDNIKDAMTSFKKEIGRSIGLTNFSQHFIFDYDFLKTVDNNIKNKNISFDLYLKLKKKEGLSIEDEIKNLLSAPLNNLNESFLKTNLSLTNVRQ